MYQLVDALEPSLPLPHGEYDVPLIVSDRMFNTDGSLLIDRNDDAGVYGDVITVNGRPWPVMKVKRRKYRFRILNASLSRSYKWSLDTGGPMTVIATDAGLMPAPQSGDELPARRRRALRGRHRLREVQAAGTPRGAAQHQPEEQHRLRQRRQGDGVRRGR